MQWAEYGKARADFDTALEVIQKQGDATAADGTPADGNPEVRRRLAQWQKDLRRAKQELKVEGLDAGATAM